MSELLNAVGSLLSTPIAVQLLGMVALVLALWQLYQARSQTNALSEIRGALSTRYLGQFPAYVADIAELVASAKARVDIVCDFPAYARFSDPDGWRSYSAALQAATRRGVEVSLVSLASEQARELRKRQFASEATQWEQWRSKNTSRLNALFQDYDEPKLDAERVSFLEFIDVLDEENTKMLQVAFSRAIVEHVNMAIPVCSWVADDARAIFTMTTYTTGILEHGFRTVDGKLISALRDMQRSYQSAARESV